MDYLRNLGSAAVSSLVQKSGLNLPFSLGAKVSSFEGKSIWSLYEGTKRVCTLRRVSSALDIIQNHARTTEARFQSSSLMQTSLANGIGCR